MYTWKETCGRCIASFRSGYNVSSDACILYRCSPTWNKCSQRQYIAFKIDVVTHAFDNRITSSRLISQATPPYMCLQRHKVTTQWLAELNGKLNGTDRQTSCAHSIERDLLASLQRNQDQVFFYVTDLNQDERSRTTFRVYIAGILVSMYLTKIVHHLLSLKLLIFYVSIQIGLFD